MPIGPNSDMIKENWIRDKSLIIENVMSIDHDNSITSFH